MLDPLQANLALDSHLNLSLRDKFLLDAILFSVETEVNINSIVQIMDDANNGKISHVEAAARKSEIQEDFRIFLGLILFYLKWKEVPLTSVGHQPELIIKGLNELFVLKSRSGEYINEFSSLLHQPEKYIADHKKAIEEKGKNTPWVPDFLLCQKALSDLDYISKQITQNPPAKASDWCSVLDFIHKTEALCLNPTLENLEAYSKLKKNTQGSWGKTIGGLVLTTLSLFLMVGSFVALAASFGASTPLSAMGITLAVDLYVVGTGAVMGASAGLGGTFAGISVVNSGKKDAFFKRVEETEHRAQDVLDWEEERTNEDFQPF